MDGPDFSVCTAIPQQFVQFLMVSIYDFYQNIRISGRKFFQGKLKFLPTAAAQITNCQRCLILTGKSGCLLAHPFVISNQNKAFSVKIFPGRCNRKFTFFSFQQFSFGNQSDRLLSQISFNNCRILFFPVLNFKSQWF